MTVSGQLKQMAKHNKEDIRWQVMKAMLDEFPTLRKKVVKYAATVEN